MKERFLALDGIRGVAALAVLFLHLSNNVLPHRGYLAVDVFFVLSGFVIAHAYEKRLLSGLSLGNFSLLRAIRLYPLVVAGVLLSVAVNLGLQLIGHPHLNFTLVQIIFGMLLLPYLTAGSVDMYLVLSPTWSLFNELVINIAYAGVARLLSNRVLIVCCAVSALILFPATVLNGSAEFGPYRGTLIMGLVRTCFSFSLGVLIYRFRSKKAFDAGALWMVILAAAAIAVFGVGDIGSLNGLYDAFAVTFAIPLIIALTAHAKPSGYSARAAALLGDLSYPVYILHWPLRSLIFTTDAQDKVPEAVFLVLSAAVICLCAFVAMKLYDEPTRKLLKAKLFRSPLAPTHPATAP